MMNLHLHAIGKAADPGSHATVLRDGAGYHKSRRLRVPANITLVPLPHYAPELNCAENIWKHPRKNKLSNIVFKSYDDIVDTACAAWRFFADNTQTVTSITQRDWTKVS